MEAAHRRVRPELRSQEGRSVVTNTLCTLFYNVHANEHATLGGKADAAGEALMMQWAAHRVTRVEHILHHSYKRVQTPHEFYSKHPRLTHICVARN